MIGESPEELASQEKWSLVFALRAGSLALRKQAIRAHVRAGNGGGEMEAAFRTADRKNTEAEALLAEAERLVRELNGEDVLDDVQERAEEGSVS